MSQPNKQLFELQRAGVQSSKVLFDTFFSSIECFWNSQDGAFSCWVDLYANQGQDQRLRTPEQVACVLDQLKLVVNEVYRDRIYGNGKKYRQSGH